MTDRQRLGAVTVDDLRLRHRQDVEAERTRPDTEVVILHLIEVGLVKPELTGEHRPVDHEAAGHQRTHAPHVRAAAGARRVLVGQDHQAEIMVVGAVILDGIHGARIDDGRRGDDGAGMLPKRTLEDCRAIRRDAHIVVDEQDQIAAGGLEADVPGAAGAPILAHLDDPHRRKTLPDQRQAVVGRTIVDQKDLGKTRRQRDRGVESPRKVRNTVIIDDAQAWTRSPPTRRRRRFHCHSCLSPAVSRRISSTLTSACEYVKTIRCRAAQGNRERFH